MTAVQILKDFLPEGVQTLLEKVNSYPILAKILSSGMVEAERGLSEMDTMASVPKGEQPLVQALANVFGVVSALKEEFPNDEELQNFLLSTFGSKVDNPDVASILALYDYANKNPEECNPFHEKGRMGLITKYVKFRGQVVKAVSSRKVTQSDDDIDGSDPWYNS